MNKRIRKEEMNKRENKIEHKERVAFTEIRERPITRSRSWTREQPRGSDASMNWRQRPSNHWRQCAVTAAVASSVQAMQRTRGACWAGGRTARGVSWTAVPGIVSSAHTRAGNTCSAWFRESLCCYVLNTHVRSEFLFSTARYRWNI